MRMILTLLILCVLALPGWAQNAPSGGGASPGDGAGDLSLPADATKAIEAGDWRKVQAALLPLVKGDADTSELVHYWYGVALYHEMGYDGAIKHLSAALKANPCSLATARYLAMAAEASHSAEALERALAAFPDDVRILLEAGRHHYGQFLRQRYEYVKNDKSEARWASEEHLQKSVHYLRTAVAVEPHDAEVRLALAKSLRGDHKADEALEHFLVADRLEALDYETYADMARCYEEVGDYSGAAAVYAAVAKAAPLRAPQIDWDRARALLRAGRYDEAVEIFREIFRGKHTHTQVRYMLGRAAYQAGDYPLALFAFRESYQADGDVEALAQAARCAYEMGQDRLAAQLIDQAIEAERAAYENRMTPYIRPEWRFVRGQALWRLAEKEKAVEDLEAAARGQPGNEQYATWAVYACRQLDDPFGVVRVAKSYALAGHHRDGLEVLSEIAKQYRLPRLTDRQGNRPVGGLPGQVCLAVAAIYEDLNDYRAAWLMCNQGGFNSRGPIFDWVPWTALRAGDVSEAEKMFRRLAEGKNARFQQIGHHGLAYLALARRDGQTALKHLEAMQKGGFASTVPTAVKWANVLAGQADAADKLDAFDLLGIYSVTFNRRGADVGLSVTALIPDSPLEAATPKVQAKDVVLTVGDRALDTSAGIESLRSMPIPEGPVRVRVRRGDRVFEVGIDLQATRAALKTSSGETGKDTAP